MAGGLRSIDPGLATSLSLGSSAVESAGLDLRSLDSGNRTEKISRIAVQFEQIMIQTLLKTATMEDEEGDKESGGLGITLDSTRDLRTLMLSQHVAENGGFGLAAVIRQQIEDAYGNAKAPATSSLKLPPAAKSTFHLAPNQLAMPVANARTSSGFGFRQDPLQGDVRFHRGIDFAVAEGTPVHSASTGQVVFSGWKPGLGHTVEVLHESGLVTRYGHNSTLKVEVGDRVDLGTVVALSGSSGRSTGPHLHFEVLREGVPQDPRELMASGPAYVLAGNAELSVDKA